VSGVLAAEAELPPALAHGIDMLHQLLGVVTAADTVATLCWQCWRLGVIGAIGTLIGTQAASLSVYAALYASAIEAKVDRLQSLAKTQIDTISKAVMRDRKPPRPPSPTAARGRLTQAPAASTTSPTPRPVPVKIAPAHSTPLQIAPSILDPVIGPLETSFIVLIVAIFVLLQKEDLRDRLIRVFGSGDLHRTTLALNDAEQKLSRYFLAQFGLNTSFGLIINLGLWLIGVPSPARWGVLAGLCRFVPYIGAVLAAVGPMALVLTIDPSRSTAMIIVGFFFVTEAILGYSVEPLLYGYSNRLAPASIIVAAIFWTLLRGPIVLIISTPVALCLVVPRRHVKALRLFEVLLDDRPALTRVEELY